MSKLAIITGADGGMGTEITKAVAFAGYHVIMACYNPVKAEPVKQRIIRETGNMDLEILPLDLASMESVSAFTGLVLGRAHRGSFLFGCCYCTLKAPIGCSHCSLKLLQCRDEEGEGASYGREKN